MEKRWTVERLLFVQQLTDAGLSSRQIAKMVARHYDCTCTQKMIRHLWGRRKVNRTPVEAPPPFSVIDEVAPIAITGGSRNGSIRSSAWPILNLDEFKDLRSRPDRRGLVLCADDLSRRCRWPIRGDRHKLFVCGRPVARGRTSYCMAHTEAGTIQVAS